MTKLEVSPGQGLEIVKQQLQGTLAMLSRVEMQLSNSDIKGAYREMNYDLIRAFSSNLEQLTSDTES